MVLDLVLVFRPNIVSNLVPVFSEAFNCLKQSLVLILAPTLFPTSVFSLLLSFDLSFSRSYSLLILMSNEEHFFEQLRNGVRVS